ncbi:MAG: shikimate kinase [Nitrospiraceae bacterium]|nr:shikimate kinase [Nitrospiraceae bacterium]
MPVRNVVLTGFMGTGKTAVSRELSHILGMKLVDIDAEIEKTAGKRIADIFSESGEAVFRDLETEAIRRCARTGGQIISTGGGAVLRQENMEALRGNGLVFCLDASPGTILSRTSGSSERPLLQTPDPLRRIIELLEYRRPFYEKAGIMIDTEKKTPLQVAEEIAERYRADTQG